MSVLEYTDEMFLCDLASGSFEDGVQRGIQDTNELYSWLKSQSRMSDIWMAIEDPIFLQKLFLEYKEWIYKNS